MWGVDLNASRTRLVRIDATAAGKPGGLACGGTCGSGTTEIQDSALRAGPAATAAFGLHEFDCAADVRDSELGGDDDGLYAIASTGTVTTVVRNSFVSGAVSSVRTVGAGDVEVFVVGSQLDGGPGTSASWTDTQECTDVTYNSGGAEVFQAATSDPCP